MTERLSDASYCVFPLLLWTLTGCGEVETHTSLIKTSPWMWSFTSEVIRVMSAPHCCIFGEDELCALTWWRNGKTRHDEDLSLIPEEGSLMFQSSKETNSSVFTFEIKFQHEFWKTPLTLLKILVLYRECYFQLYCWEIGFLFSF